MVVGQTGYKTKDERFMRLALQLAEKGRGRTSPNPMVGAVVVKKDRILAGGYHRKFGVPHAEAVVLKACGDRARGATLYTTLEPCCHFGKTPPCTDLIIQGGIKRVVCATIDPNPQVNGKGIEVLKKEGIEVSLGILKQEAKSLNEVYFKYVTTRLPFVVLRVVQTLDGRLIHRIDSFKSKQRKIFSELIRFRKPWTDTALCDANTLNTPVLKLFLQSGNSNKPKLILLGTWQEISSKLSKVKKDSRKNIIVVPTDLVTLERKEQSKLRMWKIKKRKNGEIDLVALLKKAGEENITSLLVGGGAKILTAFLKQRLVDKIWYFISPNISGKGEEPFGDLEVKKISDAMVLKNCEYKVSSNGLLVVGYPAGVGSRH